MIKTNSIINGDCLEVMKEIESKSIDMILCDLPYGTTACKWDVIIPFEPLWEQYKRIIKDNGAIVLTASQPFTSALVMSNTKMFRYELIWEKTRPSNFIQAKKQPLKTHENILLFYKTLGTYNPQKWEIDEKFIDRRKKFDNVSICNLTGFKKTYRPRDTGERYPMSVIPIISHSNAIHPTQKPVTLFEYLIKTYTNENDLVLDNCSGSGTTAIACIKTDRNYICIEKDETYCLKSLERVDNENIKLKLAI